jgi:uncharacterized damage-inducible protein DinB
MRVVHLAALIVFAYSMTTGAQAPQPPANPISQAVKNGWNDAKRNMLGSAKVMPEAKYTFKPVETVRTFGQILAHVAGANYEFCAAARGEKAPFAEDHFEKTAKTPADIVKALQDSVAYCDAAYNALDDAKAAEIIDGPFNGGKQARAAGLMGNTSHNNEHYGNLVTYLRINGLVPPSSAPSR